MSTDEMLCLEDNLAEQIKARSTELSPVLRAFKQRLARRAKLGTEALKPILSVNEFDQE